ncbi:hypothetical protein K501DRAFT_259793 [Backusella circina FSU 941]|nr:hypothetical protein K501DRAFT_259793 [Backusella circina FSU 941]
MKNNKEMLSFNLIQVVQENVLKVRYQPYSQLLFFGLVVLLCIPPMFGLSFMITAAGYIYGFPDGVVPSVLGTFIGSILCFGLIRQLNFAKYIPSPSSSSSKHKSKYQAIEQAVNQGGIKMILLLRLCPIPWQITNTMLSLLPMVDFKVYVITSLIGSLKWNLEVWAGSQLSNLTDARLPPEAQRVALISVIIGLSTLAGVATWMYHLTMKTMKEIENQKNGQPEVIKLKQ